METKSQSKAEKETPEKSSDNLNSNVFDDLDSARTIENISKSCPELKNHKDFNTAKEADLQETTNVVKLLGFNSCKSERWLPVNEGKGNWKGTFTIIRVESKLFLTHKCKRNMSTKLKRV